MFEQEQIFECVSSSNVCRFPCSTKEALKGAEERQKELEAEVQGVTRCMKEEMDRAIQQKEEEIKKAREGLEEHRERCFAAQRAEEQAREEHAGYVNVSTHITVTLLHRSVLGSILS